MNKVINEARNTKTNLVFLGGLNEIGKNMTLIEHKNEILIIDCGFKIAEESLLGIDIIIPDFSYFRANKNKIKGLLITHGHEDHIGAIDFLLKEFNIPLYAPQFTKNILEMKLSKKILKSTHISTIKPNEIFKIGSYFIIEGIHVNHSIPDAMAYYIKTPDSKLFHTGDFKIDLSPIGTCKIDLERIREIGKEGIDVLLSDSTNALKKGTSLSESNIKMTIDKIFGLNKEKRIIVTTFSSNVYRLQHITELAIKYNRKILLVGYSMKNFFSLAISNNYLNIDKRYFIEENDIGKYSDSELCIMTTGSQGEPMAGLSLIAGNEKKNIRIKENDLIIFSSSPITGNEKMINNIINKLLSMKAEVIYNDLEDIHASGHAYQEELKLIHSLVNAKYFIPVHGEYRHLKKNAELAIGMGLKRENICIAKNGDIVEITQAGLNIKKSLNYENVLIDGVFFGKESDKFLEERKDMSKGGALVILFSINKEKNKFEIPFITTRGVSSTNKNLIFDIKNEILKNKDNLLKLNDNTQLKTKVIRNIEKFLSEKYKIKPVVIPIINN